MWAVVRIRGTKDVSIRKRKTLQLLRLNKPNHCVVLPETKAYLGMLRDVSDIVTWGEISGATLNNLMAKRKAEYQSKNSKSGKNDSGMRLFRLSPPRKGFSRKGVRLGFAQGGDAGYRGKEINDLIERMI